MEDKKIDYLSNPVKFTIRGKLGYIIELLSDKPIDDPIVNQHRIGFADSNARDALTVAWYVVNDLRMALKDLDSKKRNAMCLAKQSGKDETISLDDLRLAESLIFSAICRIGRMGDEGEI